VILGATHPKVAFRNCQHCLAFVYDETTGAPYQWRGQPYPRGETKPPCQTAAGCPKGSPDSEVALSERNRRALVFHRRCEAVGRWPEDPIVERNAVVIQAAEREAEHLLRERTRERTRRKRPGDHHEP